MKILNIVPLLLLSLTSSLTKSLNDSDIKPPERLVSVSGNVRVGGLVPVHVQESNKTLCDIHNPRFSYIRYRDGTTKCYNLNNAGVLWSEAIRFSVLAANQFLFNGTNVTLGYDIQDSLNDVDVALDTVLDFTMCRRRRNGNNGSRKCSVNTTQPYVVALIGGARSEISQRVNTVASASLLPQVSYSSTSVSLSDKTKYRTFLRTIPPDNFQDRAMVDIVKKFGWSYVATVATDEDYGRRGVEGFHEEARKSNICISTQRLFHFNISDDDTKKDIQDIVRELKADTKTNVIVLFCGRPQALAVLNEAEKQRMTGKTWIASEAWGYSEDIYDFDISIVGGVIGVVTHATRLDLFEKHLASLNSSTTQNPWLLEYFRAKSCIVGNQDCKVDPSLNASILHRTKASYVMDAMYTVVLGLLDYMKCGEADAADCLRNIDLEELRKYMLKVNTTGSSGRLVNYDKQGNPGGVYYHISNLQLDPASEKGKKFVHVGNWSNGQLLITNPIYWNGGWNITPVSRCSSPCPPGHYYVKGDVSCCWKCVLCPMGQFKGETGNHECYSCPEGYVSDSNHTRCARIPEEFIRWDSVTSAILVSLSVCGVLVTGFTFGVFFKYRKTPIVKAASKYPSLLLLVSIAVMFALPLLYIGRPNIVLCHIQPIAFGLLMTLAGSLLVTKTFRLIQIFNNLVANIRDKPLVTVKTQFFMVTLMLVVEIVLIIVFLGQRSIQVNTVAGGATLPIDCGDSAKDLHTTVLLYNWFLGLICAVLAFRARSFPANFNEARRISYAMFSFSLIWLSFLIIFSGNIVIQFSVFICAAILATALDLLVCMFAPKIFVILFRPELNETDVVRADIYRYTRKQSNAQFRVHEAQGDVTGSGSQLQGSLPGSANIHQESKL